MSPPGETNAPSAPPEVPPPPQPGGASGPTPRSPPEPRRGPGEGRNSQARNPFAFMIFIAVLCAAGWFIVSWLSDTSRIEDCSATGRKNCVPLDPKLGR